MLPTLIHLVIEMALAGVVGVLAYRFGRRLTATERKLVQIRDEQLLAETDETKRLLRDTTRR